MEFLADYVDRELPLMLIDTRTETGFGHPSFDTVKAELDRIQEALHASGTYNCEPALCPVLCLSGVVRGAFMRSQEDLFHTKCTP